jgi:cephalosporin-C deacetylase-like acetyl esterase
MRFPLLIGLCIALAASAVAQEAAADKSAGENLRVWPAELEGQPPELMMKRWLRARAGEAFGRWRQEYEQRTAPEQIAAYQKKLRERFLAALGGFPERTALNPRITGVFERETFRVEKVVFESQPGLFVTAALFLPRAERHAPPYPGVLVPCGHTHNGKAHDPYQRMCALLAHNGIAALIFDPIEQGERFQLLDQNGKPRIGGTKGHTMIGVGSILLGRNTARFEAFDGMRAIDYLQSRPEVDAERIGCTGNSGGGTQTSHLMSLDGRIDAAAPSCYIMSFERLLDTIGVQDAEQNIFGQLAFGMDHADYIMMRAPSPVLILAATRDFFDIKGTWDSFRYAKRLFSRMGFPERVDLVECDLPHNYGLIQREGAARFMVRWLAGRDEAVTEPELTVLSEEEIRCTPKGQVMLLDGARSVYDLNRDYEKELAEKRRAAWADGATPENLDRVRAVAGIRPLGELPESKVHQVGSEIKRDKYTIEKLLFDLGGGLFLTGLHCIPVERTKTGRTVLLLDEKGAAAATAPGGPVEALVKKGCSVLALDVRGSGETAQTKQGYFHPEFGGDGQDWYTAYILGLSYVGMRAEDIMICARHLGRAGRSEPGPLYPVDLIARGSLGVPALHAAALEPEFFALVGIEGSLASWSHVIEADITSNQLVNAVHGALTVYDLPDLAAALGDRLTVENPVDALGRPLEEPDPPQDRRQGRVLFDCYTINFAWGFHLEGFFIDSDGGVHTYDHSNEVWHGPPDGKPSEKDLAEKHRGAEPVLKIPQKILAEKIPLIAEAAGGEVTRESAARDMGQNVFEGYLWNAGSGRYEPVLLESTGDWNEINTSKSARDLVKWLESVAAEVAEKKEKSR